MIGNTTASMGMLTERIVAWATSRSDVRGAVIVGSRARLTDRPADEFSDLDLLLLADDPSRYLDSSQWVHEIGTPIVTFLERTITGDHERRVLFDGALDVDFNFLRTAHIRILNRYIGIKSRAPFLVGLVPRKLRREIEGKIAVAGGVLRRGYRVLSDKDGLLSNLPRMVAAKTVQTLPTEQEALNSIGDFWYHALWIARKLRRGELLIAKQCCDGRLKVLLYDAVTALALAVHGSEYDTWHDLRFFEQWADPATVADLHRVYAHYDRDDIARALLATMSVYGRVAQEAMCRMGYPYPKEVEDQVTQWVKACLSQTEQTWGA